LLLRVTAARTTLVKVLVVVLVPVQTLLLCAPTPFAGPASARHAPDALAHPGSVRLTLAHALTLALTHACTLARPGAILTAIAALLRERSTAAERCNQYRNHQRA